MPLLIYSKPKLFMIDLKPPYWPDVITEESGDSEYAKLVRISTLVRVKYQGYWYAIKLNETRRYTVEHPEGPIHRSDMLQHLIHSVTRAQHKDGLLIDLLKNSGDKLLDTTQVDEHERLSGIL
jgi:hypothetical protein